MGWTWKKSKEKKKSQNELFAALEEEWYNIEEEVLIKLIDSMPHRVKAVSKSKGNPTCYWLIYLLEFFSENFEIGFFLHFLEFLIKI